MLKSVRLIHHPTQTGLKLACSGGRVTVLACMYCSMVLMTQVLCSVTNMQIKDLMRQHLHNLSDDYHTCVLEQYSDLLSNVFPARHKSWWIFCRATDALIEDLVENYNKTIMQECFQTRINKYQGHLRVSPHF